MKKIKFRIWDKSKNKFFYTYDKNSIYYSMGRAISSIDGFFHRLEQVQEDTSLVLQQFTGALDKNGVEIYEGDVVKLEAGWFYDFDRIATVDWDDEDCVFSCYWSTPDLGSKRTELLNGRNCTVVGNIFLDNPQSP